MLSIIKIRTLHRLVQGSDFYCLVRMTGVDPAHQRHQNLNLARMPISPHPQIVKLQAEIFGHI